MNAISQQLVDAAQAFATQAHEGQKRKYTGEPYINHPAAVVEIVRSVPHTPQMLAAAWLHDVVEDTDATRLQIGARFGFEVRRRVDELTDKYTPEEWAPYNRKARKLLESLRLGRCDEAVQTIKIADLIDNSRSIMEHNPAFARVYLREKALYLKHLKRGSAVLLGRAWAIVEGQQ